MMRRVLPMVVTVLLAAAACSSSSADPAVGVSGDRPTPPEPETTTTVEETTTTTLATQVVAVPDVSGLGLIWSEPIAVNETSGAVDVSQFNRFLVTDAPTGITGEESVAIFLGLGSADATTQMLVSDGGFGKKTITVVLAGEDDSVRATRYVFSTEVRDRNATAAKEDVTEAEEGFEGDAAEGSAGDTESVAEDDLSTEEEITTPESEGEEVEAEPIAFLVSSNQTTQCQPGRGHQDFIVGLCI